MVFIAYSRSQPYIRHLELAFSNSPTFRKQLSTKSNSKDTIYLVHCNSYSEEEILSWIKQMTKQGEAKIGIASDLPDIKQMLVYTHFGVRGYCNAYMHAAHYAQLMAHLKNGQSWFPPNLVNQAMELAYSNVEKRPDNLDKLELLTPREKQVALAVAEGKSNKAVAKICGISERTVKAHLTSVFEKLNIKERVALIIYLNQYNGSKVNSSTG